MRTILGWPSSMMESSDLLRVIAGPFGLDFIFKETGIDLVNDFEVAWQHFFEKWDAPFFQGLGKQRVVGVVANAAGYLPGGVPIHAVFIDEAERISSGMAIAGCVSLSWRSIVIGEF